MIKAITRQIFWVAGLFSAAAALFWLWFWQRFRQAMETAVSTGDTNGAIYLLLSGGWLLLAIIFFFINRRLRRRDREVTDQA